MTKTALPTEFLQQLNSFSDEVKEEPEEETGACSMLVNMVKNQGLAPSTEIVAWMVRAGTLLTRFMEAAVPACRQFDPVPILGMGKKGRETWIRRVKETATMEPCKYQGLDQILQKAEKEAPALILGKTASDTPRTMTFS